MNYRNESEIEINNIKWELLPQIYQIIFSGSLEYMPHICISVSHSTFSSLPTTQPTVSSISSAQIGHQICSDIEQADKDTEDQIHICS